MKIKFLIITTLLLIHTLLNATPMEDIVKIMSDGKTSPAVFKCTIPLTQRLGLTIVKVKVNNKDCNFLLDTGAPNAISKSLAEELKLPTLAELPINDGNGEAQTTKITTIQNLTIGDVVFENTGAIIYDMSQSTEIPCLKIDGIIGSNLMKLAVWQFDFANLTASISNSKNSLAISTQANAVDFNVYSFLEQPYINITIGNYNDENVLVDFGHSGFYTTSIETYKAVKQQQKQQQSIAGYGAKSSSAFSIKMDTIYYAKIDSFSLGNQCNINQIVNFSGESKFIGSEYFKNFVVTIDWSEKKIFLEVAKSQTPQDLKQFCFSPIKRDNQLIVGFVYLDAKSQSSGLEIGDQIISVNGIDYTNLTQERWCDFLNEYNSAKENKIKLVVLNKDKQQRQLTLNRQTLLK